jgi:glycogen synthase
MSKKFKIIYAPGPANFIGSYNHWKNGQDDPSRVAFPYSSQFFDLCCTLDADAYIISPCREKELLHDDRFIIEHRPRPLINASGILYYLSQFWYELKLIASAIRFRANVAVVSDGQTPWFVLSLLPWLGIQVIPSLHCTLWRKYIPPSTARKLILRLSRNFFAKDCVAILAISDEIGEQVVQLTQGQNKPILRFSPVYRREQFDGIDEPDENRSPFRVMFAGRIERNKGVFDLLEIAKRFASEGREDITFDICGNGSALESLGLATKEAKVDASFICHGYCDKVKMRDMLSHSHVVIVPTRTEFQEGFNKVVVEGILAGRPVVTSAVCPAISDVREAVVEVTPDDIKEYGDAILRLCDDWEFYEQKRLACLGLQDKFYDISRGWGARLKAIFRSIEESKRVENVLEVKN